MSKTDRMEGPSALALQKVAVAWCGEKTSHKEMDTELAKEFAGILDKYIEALIWCSGSADFGPGGKAEAGWKKVREELLKEVRPDEETKQDPEPAEDCFQIGRFYRHTTGRCIAVISRIKTTLWGECLLAEETGSSGLIAVGEDPDCMVNYAEISEDEWRKNFS